MKFFASTVCKSGMGSRSTEPKAPSVIFRNSLKTERGTLAISNIEGCCHIFELIKKLGLAL